MVSNWGGDWFYDWSLRLGVVQHEKSRANDNRRGKKVIGRVVGE